MPYIISIAFFMSVLLKSVHSMYKVSNDLVLQQDQHFLATSHATDGPPILQDSTDRGNVIKAARAMGISLSEFTMSLATSGSSLSGHAGKAQ